MAHNVKNADQHFEILGDNKVDFFLEPRPLKKVLKTSEDIILRVYLTLDDL